MSIHPLKDIEIKYNKLFINNEFVDAISGQTFPAINPATKSTITQVQEAKAEDVNKAVAAASDAFEQEDGWRQLEASERGEYLYKLAQLIERDSQYLASLESLNNGKPFKQALGDVGTCVSIFKYYAGAADKLKGDLLPGDKNHLNYTTFEPLGVCGAITPWNYPLEIASIKMAPCLAMGNTLVLKPAEQSPLTALALAALVKEVGFPPGVFNVIPGYGPTTGQPLVEHPDVRMISFTGSTIVGKLIQRLASATVKRVTLEMGGKSPLIIFPDVDLDEAVGCAFDNVMVNQGQCCVASTRTYVHESIYDEFVKRTVALAKRRSVGNPLDESIDQGPQIDQDQYDHVLELIQSGIKEGAKVEHGGKAAAGPGWFVEPTVFSNVTDDMRIAKEEIFGPVQSILKFKEVDDVIKRANATNYGLGAGVFTKDISLALRVARRLRAGQVYVNNYMESSVSCPFGGFKESGLGRENGFDNLREYAEVKCVIVKI